MESLEFYKQLRERKLAMLRLLEDEIDDLAIIIEELEKNKEKFLPNLLTEV